MAGYSVDPDELGRSGAAATAAGRCLDGADALTTQADQAAPQLVTPTLVERVLTIADSAGRTLGEGKAVLDALGNGLHYVAQNYDATDQSVRTATPVPPAPPD